MEKNCWNCMGGKGDTEGVGCATCLCGETPSNWRAGKNYVPDTNADRIRAMSDEELAKHIWKKFGCPPLKNNITCGYVGDCRDCWLEWLRQPAEED